MTSKDKLEQIMYEITNGNNVASLLQNYANDIIKDLDLLATIKDNWYKSYDAYKDLYIMSIDYKKVKEYIENDNK